MDGSRGPQRMKSLPTKSVLTQWPVEEGEGDAKNREFVNVTTSFV